MNSRRAKIIVDILMTIFLILSFVRWEASSFAFHAIVGTACKLFFILHICIHRKWIAALTKSCFTGKLNKSLKWKYIVNMLLLAIWTVAILTGFIAVVPFWDGVVGVSIWGRIHGLTARIGLVLILVHAVQHWPQIRSYFGMKKKSANKNPSIQCE